MLAFPSHLEIEVTNVCQLSCVMCPHKIMTRDQGFMSKETLDLILEEAQNRVKTCYMHMIGEPLLHPDIIDMVDAVNECGIRTSLSTNGVALTRELSQQLFYVNLSELTLAIDSLDKITYEGLRVGANFNQVLANVMQAIELREPHHKTHIQVQVILMENTKQEVDRFKDVFSKKLEKINGELLFKQYSTFAGAVDDLGVGTTPPRRYHCPKLKNSMAILWNGDVVICCRDYNGFTKVGNIHDATLQDIWKNDKYEEYRKALHSNNWGNIPFCEDC